MSQLTMYTCSNPRAKEPIVMKIDTGKVSQILVNIFLNTIVQVLLVL